MPLEEEVNIADRAGDLEERGIVDFRVALAGLEVVELRRIVDGENDDVARDGVGAREIVIDDGKQEARLTVEVRVGDLERLGIRVDRTQRHKKMYEDEAKVTVKRGRGELVAISKSGVGLAGIVVDSGVVIGELDAVAEEKVVRHVVVEETDEVGLKRGDRRVNVGRLIPDHRKSVLVATTNHHQVKLKRNTMEEIESYQ